MSWYLRMNFVNSAFRSPAAGGDCTVSSSLKCITRAEAQCFTKNINANSILESPAAQPGGPPGSRQAQASAGNGRNRAHLTPPRNGRGGILAARGHSFPCAELEAAGAQAGGAGGGTKRGKKGARVQGRPGDGGWCGLVTPPR